MGDEEIDPNLMACIKATQETLGKYVQKPPITEKLLMRPPFRFLHDAIMAVVSNKGFFKGLWLDSEMEASNLKTRETKTLFMQKFVDAMQIVMKEEIPVKVSRILAGQSPEQTNVLLTKLGIALDQGLSSDEAVKKVTLKYANGNGGEEKPEVEKVKEKAEAKPKAKVTTNSIRDSSPGPSTKKPSVTTNTTNSKQKPSPYQQQQPVKKPGLKPAESKKVVPETKDKNVKSPQIKPSTTSKPSPTKPAATNPRGPSKERTTTDQSSRRTQSKPSNQPQNQSKAPIPRSRVTTKQEPNVNKKSNSSNLMKKSDDEPSPKSAILSLAAREEDPGQEFVDKVGDLFASQSQVEVEMNEIGSRFVTFSDSSLLDQDNGNGNGESNGKKIRMENEPNDFGLGNINLNRETIPDVVPDIEQEPAEPEPEPEISTNQNQNQPQKSIDFPTTIEDETNDLDKNSNEESQEVRKPKTRRVSIAKDDSTETNPKTLQKKLPNEKISTSSKSQNQVVASASSSVTSVSSVQTHVSTSSSKPHTPVVASASSSTSQIQPQRPPTAGRVRIAPLGSTRPPSARPAPPRPKTALIQEESNFRPQTGKVANVFMEGKDGKAMDDDEDDTFVVQEIIPSDKNKDEKLNESGGMNSRRGSLGDGLLGLLGDETNNGENVTDESGLLVKQIIDTKKELEESSGRGKKGDLDFDPENRSKGREATIAEIEKLKGFIQAMARSANPLGKMMDFVQEDVDAMHREMLKWKEESAKLDLVLEAEQLETEKTLEPMRKQLKDVENAIQDREDSINATKMLILRQEEKIKKILLGLDRVNKQTVNISPFGGFGQKSHDYDTTRE